MGPKRSSRLTIGDIGRLRVEEGLWATIQYLGKHPALGPVALINPNLIGDADQPVGDGRLKEYIAFSWFPDMLKDGLIEIVDHQTARAEVPLFTRQSKLIGSQQPSAQWVITDESTGMKTIRENLTDDEINMPERIILSYELLFRRLKNGWQPSDNVIRCR